MPRHLRADQTKTVGGRCNFSAFMVRRGHPNAAALDKTRRLRCRGDAILGLVLLTAITMVAFAANSVLNRLALASGAIDPQSFALIRLLAGAVMLGVLLVLRRQLSQGLVWPGFVGRLTGVSGLLIYLFGFSAAYTQLSAGTGALILFGSVQMTMFAGALWTGEVVRPQRWVGAAMAFGGLCLLVAPGLQAGGALPMLAMAVAGGGWGFYSLVGRKALDALAATAWNFLLAVPIALVIWAVAAQPAISPQGVWLAVLSGAVTSGLGYALWYLVLPKLGAARAAVAQLTVPVLAAAGGLLTMGEAVTLRFVIAAVVVLTGVAVASR